MVIVATLIQSWLIGDVHGSLHGSWIENGCQFVIGTGDISSRKFLSNFCAPVKGCTIILTLDF